MSQDQNQSVLTNPKFLIAAVLIVLIVVAGVVVTVVTLAKLSSESSSTVAAAQSGDASSDASDESSGTDSTKTEAKDEVSTSPEPAADAGDASICGLKGVSTEGSLTTAPEVMWQYQGTMAYPTSSKYGPGATDSSGFNYCFQHSPEGALLAASNALAAGTDSVEAKKDAWIDYFIAPGPYYNEILSGGNQRLVRRFWRVVISHQLAGIPDLVLFHRGGASGPPG